MKVLVNGGLNLSELDGWWAEAYSPELGWALGDGREHGEDPWWDAIEAAQLYTLLEEHIIPEFHSRDAKGIPTAWVRRMRDSMARLTPTFSSNRAVREYTEKYYQPAAAAYNERAQEAGKLGAAVLEWRRHLEQHWGRARFGQLKAEAQDDQFIFEVQVYLDELDADAVSVELYADAQDGGIPLREQMHRGQALVGSKNSFVYSARVPANRPAGDFTMRIVPCHVGAFVPMEANQILWQR